MIQTATSFSPSWTFRRCNMLSKYVERNSTILGKNGFRSSSNTTKEAFRSGFSSNPEYIMLWQISFGSITFVRDIDLLFLQTEHSLLHFCASNIRSCSPIYYRNLMMSQWLYMQEFEERSSRQLNAVCFFQFQNLFTLEEGNQRLRSQLSDWCTMEDE